MKWELKLRKPRNAILYLRGTSVGDPYARYFIVRVNGRQIFRRAVSGSFSFAISIPNTYLKDGVNVFEFIITTYVGYWTLEAKLIVEEEKVVAPVPIPKPPEKKGIFEQIMTQIQEFLKRFGIDIEKLEPSDVLAYAGYTLLPTSILLPLAIEGGKKAYEELKKKGVIK